VLWFPTCCSSVWGLCMLAFVQLLPSLHVCTLIGVWLACLCFLVLPWASSGIVAPPRALLPIQSFMFINGIALIRFGLVFAVRASPRRLRRGRARRKQGTLVSLLL